MSRDNEYQYSEKPALDVLDTLGYEVHDIREEGGVLSVDTRDDPHRVVLEDRLRDSIRKLNPWINENNLTKAVNKIRLVQEVNTMRENREIHGRLLRHIALTQDLGKGKKNQTVKYIDWENPENNDFLAVNQFKVEGPVESIIPDIVVFVNGLPLGVIECKSPTLTEPRSKALDQLTRYQNKRGEENEGAERLFRYNQFSLALWKEGAVYGTYGSPREEYRQWKDPYPATDDLIKEELGVDKLTPQDKLLYSLFKRDKFLDLTRHFTVFEDKGQNVRKLVARYQQYRATEKALERIERRDKSDTNGGVVWHTQGSGKSLTMLFLAMKLRRLKANPTLLLVTDRTVLDNQIHSTFEQCGFPNPKQAKSVEDLKEKLSSGAGETITTLIQKFQTKDEENYEEFPVLSRSEEIYAMVDEAHRTQYKDLANNMRTGLPNAFYIGFTGTPIEKDKRNTRKTFGNYIDTYTIDQSRKDGATEKILYQSRLADIHLDGADLDAIFDRVFTDLNDKEKAELKKRHAREQDLAEAPKRIKTVAMDLIEHFERKISDPFKGMVVTVSRESAITYKKTLDELNGPESAVMISGHHNDRQELKEFTPSEQQKRTLKDRFQDPNDPLKLFVVCDMLLTGFDAPIAQVMYLDKPLKGHSLLQAIARVNRPYEDKNYGLIVDYYGVAQDLQQALWKFSRDDVREAMIPLEEQQTYLESSHRKATTFFSGMDLDDLETCVESLEDEERRIRFNRAFKEFSKYMDIVLPDPAANPYKKDLKRLGDIYAASKNRYRDDSMDLRGCGRKVRELIKEHISSSGIQVLNQEPVSITDKKEWEEHVEELETDKARASEMEHAIKDEINVHFDEDPVYYESLQNKVEELIEAYKEKRLEAKEVLEEFEDIISDIRNRRDRAKNLGLNGEAELSFYHMLEASLDDDKEHLPDDLDLTEVTKDIASLIKEETVVEWKRKVKVQQKMRKNIKLYLLKELDGLDKDILDTLVNKLIEIAREHYYD